MSQTFMALQATIGILMLCCSEALPLVPRHFQGVEPAVPHIPTAGAERNASAALASTKASGGIAEVQERRGLVQISTAASPLPSAAVLLQSSSQLVHLPANWSDSFPEESGIAMTPASNASSPLAAPTEEVLGENDTAARALLQHMESGNQDIDAVALALLDDVAYGNNSLAALSSSNSSQPLMVGAALRNDSLAVLSGSHTIRPLLATVHSLRQVFPEKLESNKSQGAATGVQSAPPMRFAEVQHVASSIVPERTANAVGSHMPSRLQDEPAPNSSRSAAGPSRPAEIPAVLASRFRRGEGAAANKTGHAPLPAQLRSYREWPSEPRRDEVGPSLLRRPVFLMTVAALVSALAYFCFSSGVHRGSSLRVHVESLPVCTAHELERFLPSAGGYDCVLSKPMSSRQLLRLEVTVEGPMSGSALTAPLMQQACVLYWSSVTRQLHEGMQPVPVAFASSSVTFMVSLVDAPDVRIELRGDDVSLFDMCSGRRAEALPFASAPEHWQDFVLSHRAAGPGGDWQSSAVLRGDGALLEFQECALALGASVTLVGELHRAAGGGLALMPLRAEDRKPRWRPAESIGWRTSWEASTGEACERGLPTPRGGTRVEARPATEKVLASDDPLLLSGKLGGRFAGLANKPGWQ